MHTWHIVTNAHNTILAVYGSALEHEASAKALELSRLGFVARFTVRGERPRVGQQCPGSSYDVTPTCGEHRE